MIGDTLYKLTEWALRPIRRIMPDTGAIDLSPVVLFLILWLIQAYLPMILLGGY
jgi:YggT family protein